MAELKVNAEDSSSADLDDNTFSSGKKTTTNLPLLSVVKISQCAEILNNFLSYILVAFIQWHLYV